RRFLNEVRTEAGLESIERAEKAALLVLSALLRRVTPDEAMDLMAQLPMKIAAKLRDLPPGPDKSITLQTILDDLTDELGVSAAEAEGIVSAVARTLDENVSAGQMDDIRSQLPAELRHAFSPAMSGGSR
ncbi:MAG TPA: DUF2267 domain-containing protein, partial [Vicinamibacterales bacterium]